MTPSTTVNGVLSDPNAATDGGKITNGVWTATGSSAAMATALNGLVFTPNATQAAGTALTTTFTASIKDTLGQTASAKTTVTANAAASTSPTTTTIGSGSDTVVLNVNEDYYLGNAQFTVSVDGTRIGGTQTATAIHSLGQSQTFDIKGSFGVGAHTVAVDFLNDAYGGSASTDRNLYVTSASYDGIAASDASLILASAGTQSFTVGTPASVATTIGSGTDTIALGVSEDAYLGNAQFTVSVDGKQIGGTQTVTALNPLGQTQTLDVKGTFGAGTHTVAVDFLNDAYGGSATEDRNLFVTSASYDGVAASKASLTLASSGVQTITVGTQAPLAAALQALSTTAQNSTDTGQTTYTPGAAGGDITTSTGDTVQVGTGNVTVHATGASVTVFGGDGALTFIGGSGTDTVTGAAGDMIIKASNAILKFTAGAGNATITAGSKSEALTIINGQAGGLITISDFNAHLDSFHLQGYAAGTATQKIEGGSTDITLSDHTQIVLVGTVLTHSLFA